MIKHFPEFRRFVRQSVESNSPSGWWCHRPCDHGMRQATAAMPSQTFFELNGWNAVGRRIVMVDDTMQHQTLLQSLPVRSAKRVPNSLRLKSNVARCCYPEWKPLDTLVRFIPCLGGASVHHTCNHFVRPLANCSKRLRGQFVCHFFFHVWLFFPLEVRRVLLDIVSGHPLKSKPKKGTVLPRFRPSGDPPCGIFLNTPCVQSLFLGRFLGGGSRIFNFCTI